MKVLITGGSGFIGTNLIADLIAAGHVPYNYDIALSLHYPELTTLGDVRDRSALTQAAKGMDAIIHLAAVHRDDEWPVSRYYEVNVGGARHVVAAATSNRISLIVFTSTVALYGLNAGVPSENSAPQPFNDYGRSKLQAEAVFADWAECDPNRSMAIVRPSVIFGERNRGNVYVLLSQLRQGRFFLIGSGQNRKSMAYVKNVTGFILKMLEFGPGLHIYNYADKPDLTISELIDATCATLKRRRPIRVPYIFGISGGYIFDLLSALTGKNYPISAVRVRKFCAETVIDTRRLDALQVRPFCSLQEGLLRTIQHEFLR